MFLIRFKTQNGIKQDKRRYLKAGSDGTPISVVEGFVSYVTQDGSTINTGYIADKFSYRVIGAHLPTSPPTPAEIQESLRYLASLPKTPEPVYN